VSTLLHYSVHFTIQALVAVRCVDKGFNSVSDKLELYFPFPVIRTTLLVTICVSSSQLTLQPYN